MLAAPALLCRPSGRVLGAAPGTAPTDVVLTIASRGVFVHDALAQTCRCNWAVSPGTELSGAAVVHAHARRYTVVVDGSSLCGWHEDDREFGTARIRLAAPIHAILRLGPHATAAVHHDGAVTVVDATLAQRAPTLALATGGVSGGGAMNAHARCIWAGVADVDDAADAPNPARHAGGELLVLLVEANGAAEPAGGAARGARAGRGEARASTPARISAGTSPSLRLHVLRVSRAAAPVSAAGAGAGAGQHRAGSDEVELDETGDSCEPVALPSLERLTPDGGIPLCIDAGGVPRSLESAAASLTVSTVSPGSPVAERALALVLCWRGGDTSVVAVDVAASHIRPFADGAWARPRGVGVGVGAGHDAADGNGEGEGADWSPTLALPLTAPYFALVRACARARGEGSDDNDGAALPVGVGVGGVGVTATVAVAAAAARSLRVVVFENRCGTAQGEAWVDLPAAAGAAGARGEDTQATKRRRGGGGGVANGPHVLDAGVGVVEGARASAPVCACLTQDGRRLALCCAEIVLTLPVSTPRLSLARVLRAAPLRALRDDASARQQLGAAHAASRSAGTGASAGGLARGWPCVQLLLSSADLLDSLSVPTAVPAASVGAWVDALRASAALEAAAVSRALAALDELAARAGDAGDGFDGGARGVPSPNLREIDAALCAALGGGATNGRAAGTRGARARSATGEATLAAPKLHPLAALSSHGTHQLLGAACEAHAGSALLRALVRLLLPRVAVSAPALPQLLPSLIGPIATRAEPAEPAVAERAEPAVDASVMNVMNVYLTYAAEIPEEALIVALRWLLPRARAERIANGAGSDAAGADDAGEAGTNDRTVDGAPAADDARGDGEPREARVEGAAPARPGGGAGAHPRAAPSRACALLGRVCACPKSDELLLPALSTLRADEATELLAQLTLIIRTHAAKWTTDSHAQSHPADADFERAHDAAPAAPARRGGRPRPSLWQAVDWACALVDAHLVSFAIHPDARVHVRALAALVGRHVRLNRAVQRLHGYLAQLLRSAAAPSVATAVPEYSVEVVRW